MTTTTATPDLSTQTPAEVDTALVPHLLEAAKQHARWENACRILDDPRLLNYQRSDAECRQAQARDALDAAETAAAPYEAEFRARPWSRFFLVTNDNGHVHRERSCSTCFPRTQYAWLPHISGATEEEMVEQYGEMACTVCFPSAPAMKGFGDGTSVVARATATEKAERQAEKAAKAAAKLAKAIRPDGAPVRIGHDRLTTIVAVERLLSQKVQDFGWYGPEHPSDFRGQARHAVLLLLERGIPQDRITGIINRAAEKVRKEGGAHDLRTA